MSNAIKLECPSCGKNRNYARSIDPDIPPEVVRMETTCEKCSNGGFGDEHWFDANGNEVIPEWAQ